MRLFWSNQRADSQLPIASAQPPSQHQDNIPIASIVLQVGGGIFSRALLGDFFKALVVESAHG